MPKGDHRLCKAEAPPLLLGGGGERDEADAIAPGNRGKDAGDDVAGDKIEVEVGDTSEKEKEADCEEAPEGDLPKRGVLDEPSVEKAT